MLQEDDDELGPGAGRKSTEAIAAARLKDAGQWLEARDLLEAADLDQEDVAIAYGDLLHSLEDHARLQVVVTGLINGLAESEPSDRYLQFIMRNVERCCLDTVLAAKVLEVVTPRARRGHTLRAHVDGLRRRQSYRLSRLPAVPPATLISLGQNCLPWTLPNRWGWRDAAACIGEFSPFSQAFHRIEQVISVLRTDFATYMGPGEVMAFKTAAGRLMPLRRDRTAIWNHNSGPFWVDDDFARLRASVAIKIENFRRISRQPSVVFLLGACSENYPKEELKFLPALKEALAAFTGRPVNYMALTNHRGGEVNQNPRYVDEHTAFFYSSFPRSDYQYYGMKNYNSPEGLAFERRFVGSLSRCLELWGFEGARDPGAVQVAAG